MKKQTKIITTKIIKKLLKESAREEASLILSHATEEEKNDFLKHYNTDQHNICCLCLDFIKARLVKEQIMKQKKSDNFGGYL